jgi:hypothetical protein
MGRVCGTHVRSLVKSNVDTRPPISLWLPLLILPGLHLDRDCVPAGHFSYMWHCKQRQRCRSHITFSAIFVASFEDDSHLRFCRCGTNQVIGMRTVSQTAKSRSRTRLTLELTPETHPIVYGKGMTLAILGTTSSHATLLPIEKFLSTKWAYPLFRNRAV